jgi:glutamate N-acetyltransferase/amino-acid N-acetyltransferase
VILLANGKSGGSIDEDPILEKAFQEALTLISEILAKKIVSDGEKITKIVTLEIKGCSTFENAEKVARAIGNSLLVKTSFYGSDPNWGRIVDAAGYARVGLKLVQLNLHYNAVPALLSGIPQVQNADDLKAIAQNRSFTITLDLNQGDQSFKLITTDLSEAYVDFNKSE